MEKDQHNNGRFNEWANPGRGMQGVDKAPGEEAAQSTDNPISDTQKAAAKEDGDPTEPSDQEAKKGA